MFQTCTYAEIFTYITGRGEQTFETLEIQIEGPSRFFKHNRIFSNKWS